MTRECGVRSMAAQTAESLTTSYRVPLKFIMFHIAAVTLTKTRRTCVF